MEERNANNPGGIDMGPYRIVHPDMNESIITAIPSQFRGGIEDSVSPKKAFAHGTSLTDGSLAVRESFSPEK